MNALDKWLMDPGNDPPPPSEMQAIANLRQERDRLRAALKNLVEQMQLVHAHPLYHAVWASAMAHGIDYSGEPSYGHEFKMAQQVLAETQ